MLRVQTALSHMQLTNKDSPEIADWVNTLRGDIIAFHVVEVTNVIQVDLRMILNCPKAGNRYNLSSSSPCPHFPTKYFLLTSLQSLQIPANLELLSYFNLTNELQASGCSSAWPLTAEVLDHSFTRAVGSCDHVERASLFLVAVEVSLSWVKNKCPLSSFIAHFCRTMVWLTYSAVWCLNWHLRRGASELKIWH